MTMPFRPIFSLLAVALVLSGYATVRAEQRPVNRQQPQREQVRGKGKIKVVGPGVLQVVGNEGEQWLVGIEAQPRDISLQGTASVGFLRPGMLVQFSTHVDKKGEAHAPITGVQIVAPRPNVELKLQPTGGLGGKQLFAEEGESTGKRKRREGDDYPVNVSGTIRSLKDRKFYVSTGSATIHGEFAEDCTVTVDLADYSLSRPGDAIEFDGWQYPGQSGRVFATRLTISAEEPLLSVEELRRKRAGTRGTEKSDKKAGEQNSRTGNESGKEKKDLENVAGG